MEADSRIVDVDAVPEDGNVRFTVRDVEEASDVDEASDEGSSRDDGSNGDGSSDPDGDDSVREAILLRLGDDVVAYENYCQHWTDVRLDSGSGAALRNDEIVCEKHGAYFELDTGYCNFGPCEGAVLADVEVTVADGAVYLTDDRYAFEGVGPADDADRSSGSRIGFSGN